MKILKKLALPIILLGALLIRLWNYTDIALWHDEAFSALLIRMPFAEMMHRIALDVHPPFYYWLLDLWAYIFGHTLASLRGFSVLFGVAAVFMLYILIKDLTRKTNLALAASALLAVNPFHIQYSLEARMYTLGTFLIIASSWMLLKALKTNKWKWWLPYALFTTATALTHYFLFFSIAAQAIFTFVWWAKHHGREFMKMRLKSDRHTWRWLDAYLLSFALYIPWLPTFWKQFSQVQENYWIPAMNIWSIPSTLWKIVLGGFQGANETVLTISSAILIGLFIYYLIKYKGLKLSLPVYMAVIPFILSVLVSLKTAIFLDRYFIFTAVFVVAVVAMALVKLNFKKVGVLLTATLLIASLGSYNYAWADLNVDEKPGMSAASSYILDNYPIQCPQNVQNQPRKMVVGSTFVYFSYQYYYETYKHPNPRQIPSYACQVEFAPKPKLYLPGIEDASQLPHFSGTALLENQDFIGSLDEFAQEGEEVWLLWTTGFGGTKSVVPENWQQLDEQKFPDVFPHRGDIFVIKYKIVDIE